MTDLTAAGTFALGDGGVNRMGYGAMQLAGPGVFGPPKDRDAAIAVLREAIARGVNHIDTSDYYGPYVTNQIIREALHPYPRDLVIVTKVGAMRGADGSWNPAFSPADLARAVHDNLRNLGLDAMDVVDLRVMGKVHAPSEGSIEEQFVALAELQRQGLVRQLGLEQCDVHAGQAGARHRQSRLRAEPLQPRPSRGRRVRRRTGEGRHRLCAVLSLSAASRRCNPPRYPKSRRNWGPRRCRSRWPGCCTVRPTFC